MTLGAKIRKYRLLKNLTQAQLGAMVRLTGDRIRQYENNVRKPKKGKLVEIAEALGINPFALSEPNLAIPDSVIHTLFELEDIYGLHFEGKDGAYYLAFSEGKDCQELIEDITKWIKKRQQLQSDLIDFNESVIEKKEEYAVWKACYPRSE